MKSMRGSKCPKCGKYTYRKQVSVVVDMPALSRQASKKYIAKPNYQILGVLWDQETDYCINMDCRFSIFLNSRKRKKKK
jgi:hypothetical protein